MALTWQQLMTSDVSNPEARQAVFKLSGLSGLGGPDFFLRNPRMFTEHLNNIKRVYQDEYGQSNAIYTSLQEYNAGWGPEVSATARSRGLAEIQEQKARMIKAGLNPVGLPTEKYEQMFNQTPGTGTSAELRRLETSLYSPGQATYNDRIQAGKLPQSAEQALDVIAEQMAQNPPAVGTTAGSYLAQAEKELGPHFSQLYSQAKQDIQTGFRQIGEDLQANERALGQQYGKNLEATQEEAARRGLTFSSKREGAEKDLLSQTQQAIEAGRKEAERRALSLGTEGERVLGSSNLPQLSQVANAPTPITGQAGVYGFSQGTGTRSLFQPTGNTTGTLEQRKLEDTEARAKELRNIDQEKRGYYLPY